MIITDQPGRILAVFVFAPFLIYKGKLYKDNHLIMFGFLLFFISKSMTKIYMKQNLYEKIF